MVTTDLTPDIRLKYWRIRLQYFPHIAFLGALVSVISRFSTFPSFRIFLAETLMQLVGVSAVYAFWVYTSKILKHFDKDRLSRTQIMAIGAVGGLIMALSQSALSWLFVIPLQTSFFMRAIGNVIVAAFWLPLQSVVVGNFNRYSRLKQEMREEFLQQESVQLARRRVLEEYRMRIEEDIQNKLKITTTSAHSLFSSVNRHNFEQLPEHLRKISDKYFRLTAHKMESEAKSLDSKSIAFRSNFLELKAAVIESISRRPLNPSWFAIVIVVTIIVPLTAKAEYLLIPTIALATGASTFVVQYLLLKSFNFITTSQIAATYFATCASIAIPIYLAHLIPNNDPVIGNHIAYAIVVVTVTLLGHIAQAGILKEGELRSSSVNDLFELKKAEREQNAQFSRITREWAKYIHGNYTTKLEAAALAIEMAIESDDAEGTERAIREVERTLQLDSVRYKSNPKVLVEEVKDRCANWQGLIEIQTAGQVHSDVVVTVSIKDVGDCIEEALLNAVRHGDCSAVEISVSDLPSCISIQIKDNGRGFTGKPRGFGSSIFEEATRGDWKLWRDQKNEVTILELNFAKS